MLESKLKDLKVVEYAYFNERQIKKIVKGAMGSIHTLPDILTELKTNTPIIESLEYQRI